MTAIDFSGQSAQAFERVFRLRLRRETGAWIRAAASAVRFHAGAGAVAIGAVIVGVWTHAAFAVDLPDGLPKVFATDHPSYRFDGATRSYLNNNQTLRIDQSAERAVLHWRSFDIARDKAVEFRQPSRDSIALNRVLGGTAEPSRIQGRLDANGQVYLINQNGILFGNEARVNVNSLIASTFDIDDEIFEGVGFVGAINRPDPSELEDLAAFDLLTNNDADGDGKADIEPGAIECAEGCRIVSGENGRILLFAPSVINRGHLSAPDGQVVLAAPEDRVYVAVVPQNEENNEFGTKDLSGLLWVEVDTGAQPTADDPDLGVRNLGEIIAERGNISLVGMAVNQEGLVRATTSVSRAGSIRLVAQDLSGSRNAGTRNINNFDSDKDPRSPEPDQGGVLTLGANSITEVLAEDDPTAVVDAQSQPLSKVYLRGRQVTLEEAARVTATGGTVDIVAREDPGFDDSDVVIPTAGAPQIRIEADASIDVSGDADTQVSVARNFVEVEARGNELADSPLQREGALRNKTLTVDIRKGTPLLNTDNAFAGAIERDVGERLSTGGTVSLTSEGRIDIAADASLDIGGGRVTYAGDTVSTSLLLTEDGRVVDIAHADPNVRYIGVLGDIEVEHPKWGINESFANLLGLGKGVFEAGYVEGKDAGELTLSAPSISFEGELRAQAFRGLNQRYAPSLNGVLQAFARPFDQVPVGGRLSFEILDRRFPDLFIGRAQAETLRNGHPVSIAEPLVLPPELIADSGLSRVSLTSTGRVLVNTPLVLPAFGELELIGTQVLIDAPVRIPGGDVAIARQTALESGSGFSIKQIDAAALAAIEADVDVSGTWNNDSEVISPEPPTGVVVNDGGRLQVGATLEGEDRAWTSIELATDTVLDVGGGAQLTRDGELTGGRGGAIRLLSDAAETENLASLDLQGELRGSGVERGGSLEVVSDEILIGSLAAASAGGLTLDSGRQFLQVDADTLADWDTRRDTGDDPFWRGLQIWGDGRDLSGQQITAWDLSLALDQNIRRNLLVVDATTFGQGGFQSFEFGATRFGLGVLPGTRVDLQAATPVLDGAVATTPSRDSLTGLGELTVLSEYDRSPVDLTLWSSNRGALNVGSGAEIVADPGGRISLEAVNSLYIDGTLEAAAGEIELLQTGVARNTPSATRKIWLGPGARLLAQGAVRVDPVSLFGERRGEVLDAGRIRVRAEQGAVFGAAGAEINVDAVATELHTGFGTLDSLVPVGGRAGAIALSASESLAYAGRLSGDSVLQEEGGRLSVTLDPSTRGVGDLVSVNPGFDRGANTALMQDYQGALPGAGEAYGEALQNRAYVPVSQIDTGGFGSLAVTVRSSANFTSDRVDDEGKFFVPDTPESLPGIEFRTDLSLDLARSLILDAAVLSATGSTQVALQAAHVALGSSDQRVRLEGAVPAQDGDGAIHLPATAGDGRLRVEGDLIELVGEMVTQGFGRPAEGVTQPGIELSATRDLRLRGVRTREREVYDGLFRTASDLAILAERIYPTTLTRFELSADVAGAGLDIQGRGETTAPLSLGGFSEFRFDHIRQGGSVFAPLGSLNWVAGSTLELAAGSLTSTSASGVRAPFFNTQPGGDLVLPSSKPNDATLVFTDSVEEPAYERLLPEQSLVLQAPGVDIQDGARFDLGGGTLSGATEFVPGPGGSRDILLADLDPGVGVAASPSFAIVPGIGEYAPYDPLETPASASAQGLRIGDTVLLDEGLPGLPAGEYAVLPPRYALFGGYLLTPEGGTLDLSAGLGLTRADGAPVLAGRYGVAGSQTVSSRSQGFAIEDGSRVRNRAEYLETPLADFYPDPGGVRRPDDAGTLVLDAGTTLGLGGQIVADAVPGGLGPQVDILADRALSIGDGEGIVLDVEALERLGAESLLVGGSRSQTSDAVIVTPEAQQVNVADGVSLTVPELILVGAEVTVGSTSGSAGGVRLESSAARSDEAVRLRVEGDDSAALLAVSNRSLTIERPSDEGSQSGQLAAYPNAVLSAAGSIAADVAGDADFAAAIEGDGALISLGAASIALGETEGLGLSDGLVLSNSALEALDGANLRLRSGSDVTLHGALPVAGDDGEEGLRFGRLTFDAQGLLGVGNAGRVVRLAANEIRFENTSGSTPAYTGIEPSSGTLTLEADRLLQGEGEFALQGFAAVDAFAGTEIRAVANGRLFAEAPLSLSAPLITAVAGVDSRFESVGADLRVSRGAGSPDLSGQAMTDLSASLAFAGQDVEFGGLVRLPSGKLRIEAKRHLAVESGALLDLSGITAAFGPAEVGTPGGTISLASETGSVSLADEAVLDVSPSPLEGQAGTVAIEAVAGTVDFQPGVVFRSGARGGAFRLDAAHLTVGSENGPAAFGRLQPLLGSGFSDRRETRLRVQSINLPEAEELRAREVRIVSDTGDLSIDGTIDASGFEPGSLSEDGGLIVLAAGDSVVLGETAILRATGALEEDGLPAVGTSGGLIEFIALDSDGSDPSGARDRVELSSGALLDVRGGAEPAPPEGDRLVRAPSTRGGKVLIRTRRLDADGDGQSETLVLGESGATVIGAARRELVATRVIRPGDRVGSATFDLDRDIDGDGVFDDASLTEADLDAIRTDIEVFVDNDSTDAGIFSVVPGVDIESPGDLVLEDDLDFYTDWHFDRDAGDRGVTGHFSLRAAQDLSLEGDLSDAFFVKPQGNVFFPLPDLPDRLATAVLYDADGNPLPPSSWGYRLVAGADTTSADPAAVNAGSGDLEVHGRVRTGTADIEIATGKDVTLAAGAAIYTAGYDLGLSDNVRSVAPGFAAFDSDYNFNVWMGEGALFPTDGGDVRLLAGGNVSASARQTSPAVWQPRIGAAARNTNLSSSGSGPGAVPTHWGVAFHRFTDGIGTLGGGALTLRAGGDLSNLAIALPTTGRAISGAVAAPGNTLTRQWFDPALETTEVAGGGKLRVEAGGSLLGGSLHLGDGRGRVSLDGAALPTDGSVLKIYNGFGGQLELLTGQGQVVGDITDSTVVPLDGSQFERLSIPRPTTAFFTYDQNAGIGLQALTGDILLTSATGFARVPPTLSTVAHTGDISLEADVKQYPSPVGQLEFLADGDLTGIKPGGIGAIVEQSDQDRTLLATIDRPDLNAIAISTGDPTDHALLPVHLDDDRSNLFVAREGSIQAGRGNDRWALDLAKVSIFHAGQDLRNLSVNVQQVSPRDVSAFIAGRDIVQEAARDTESGDFVFDKDTLGTAVTARTKYEIAGPGAAQFIVGRSMVLGTSAGIASIGDQKNLGLADEGASLLLMAGLGGEPAYDDFLQTYLVEQDTYTARPEPCLDTGCRSPLEKFLAESSLLDSDVDPLATFVALDRGLQRQFVAEVLLTELKASGSEGSANADYSRGFAAIETLFPTSDPSGGISMLLSTAQTVEGGDLEILVPGGGIDAGAAASDLIKKAPDKLGIINFVDGDIGIFVDGDLIVNSTRVFALQKDLMVWSSNGSIDAGKGAKTVSSIPTPTLSVDENGNPVLETPPAVEGSGLLGVDTFLFAPRGVVNAGDAGIRATGDLTIGATEIIGSDNIDIGGASVGFALGPPPSIAVGLTGVTGATASTSKVAEQATEDQVASQADDSSASAGQGLALLNVEVIGFGD